jgi:four helix bundle protein
MFNKRFRFRDFSAYKTGRKFCSGIKNVSLTAFPTREKFGLVSQLNRALDSILLNIAEGSARSTNKDFAHFLNLATSSLNEVVACLDIAFDMGYIRADQLDVLLHEAAELSSQLTAFRRSLLHEPV